LFDEKHDEYDDNEIVPYVIETQKKSSKGSAPIAPPPTASKGGPAPIAPPPTASKGDPAPISRGPLVRPVMTPTFSPSDTPTVTPPCVGTTFTAVFDAPQSADEKQIKSEFSGTYLTGKKVQMNLLINFGDWQPNKARIKVGDELDWSINTMWQDNPDIYGWNNKCRPARAGLHYDPTVKCGPVSENVITPSPKRRLVLTHRRMRQPTTPYCVKDDGNDVLVSDYKCETAIKKKKKCEQGDLSGKLGPLVVEETMTGYLRVRFEGKDPNFPKKMYAQANADAGTPWSIVISKNGKPFMCSQFIFICDNK